MINEMVPSTPLTIVYSVQWEELFQLKNCDNGLFHWWHSIKQIKHNVNQPAGSVNKHYTNH